ncbi:MAG: peptidylprolyl isomerase [Muribaculaceae bacterium]|uniref:peptidylprolyl isomerase n=2 Tax=Duncaniella TaxID=2518495 RepID=UPI000F4A62B7|nr:peptidylprolyl isomerase [Muribaculaceae bacterium]ROS89786.1 peptidylprolyl isomerase [Muribaculaceae bacterium Isolate-080 (Janvier)]
MKIKSIILLGILLLSGAVYVSANTDNVAEEVAWVVGDQPIWKSEIEEAYQNMRYEGVPVAGDPYCVVPEQLAIEKLYLHQAEMDTIEIPDAMVFQNVEQMLNGYIMNLGSKEKVEQYFNKSIPALRESLREMVRNRGRVQEVQRNLTKDVKATPAAVRRFFEKIPTDSVPWVPLQVETQILTVAPAVPREAVEDVKARLRNFTEQVNKGESQFSTLAILYSEDPGSAARGGELGFSGRAEFVPEFSAVAFNLNDPKKVSKIVETEYGFHIIQLIEKRGDRINVRHILLKPKVAEKDLTEAVNRMDSLRSDILDKKFTFEDAVFFSQDKTTRNNKGHMVNENTGSTRFQMSELPQEVAKRVADMEPGDISEPFIMTDPKTNHEIVAMVKLTSRIPGHKANISDDFQLVKSMYENSRRQEILDDWLANKIKNTYIRIEDGWRNCDFKNKGWIK